MKIEEYGKENTKTIVMLHGAHFVHSFGRQYSLSNNHHIIVSHIMGFGDIWDRAGHNIPFVYVGRLNELSEEMEEIFNGN